jgi:hypothetical protein
LTPLQIARLIDTETGVTEASVRMRLADEIRRILAKGGTQKVIMAALAAAVVRVMNEERDRAEEIALQLIVAIAGKALLDTVTNFWTRLFGILGKHNESWDNTTANWKKRIPMEYARLKALQTPTSEIIDALAGTKRMSYKDGFANMAARGAAITVNADLKNAETAARLKVSEKEGAVGYQWHARFENTCVACMKLDGDVFYFKRSGQKPIPQIHPRCRCFITPYYGPNDKRNVEDKSLTQYINEEKEKQVVDDYGRKGWQCPGKDHLTWSKERPADGCKPALGGEARYAMGETRWKLYTQGRLKIERFVGPQWKPYTVDELRKRNEYAWHRAYRDHPAYTGMFVWETAEETVQRIMGQKTRGLTEKQVEWVRRYEPGPDDPEGTVAIIRQWKQAIEMMDEWKGRKIKSIRF